jgi:hypothetical protein
MPEFVISGVRPARLTHRIRDFFSPYFTSPFTHPLRMLPSPFIAEEAFTALAGDGS